MRNAKEARELCEIEDTVAEYEDNFMKLQDDQIELVKLRRTNPQVVLRGHPFGEFAVNNVKAAKKYKNAAKFLENCKNAGYTIETLYECGQFVDTGIIIRW